MHINTLTIAATVVGTLTSGAVALTDGRVRVEPRDLKFTNGFCVTSHGQDVNEGVHRIMSGDFHASSLQYQCAMRCLEDRQATGVEVIWHQGNRGCYCHRSSRIARGVGIPVL